MKHLETEIELNGIYHMGIYCLQNTGQKLPGRTLGWLRNVVAVL